MILRTPLGKTVNNPTPNDIYELLDQDYKYWIQGSGSASLSNGLDEDDQEALIFYQDLDYGFVILQIDEYRAPFGKEINSNLIIAHDISGEPFPVPLSFYIDRSSAEEILLHYLQTGSIVNFNQWGDIYENFDYDAYLSSEHYNNRTKAFEQG